MRPLQRLAAVIACILLAVVVFGIIQFSRNTGYSSSGPLPIDDASEAKYVDVTIPSKDATPEQVVTRQLNSLHESLTDPDQLKVCYSLASPDNRKQTGPFNRFAAMVMQPPYDQLAISTAWQVGSAEIDHDQAAVLVTSSDPSQQPQAFRFLLRMHGRPPYEGCWLTDAVQIAAPTNE